MIIDLTSLRNEIVISLVTLTMITLIILYVSWLRWDFDTATIFMILNAILSFLTILAANTLPHEPSCKCEECYKVIGTENGIELYINTEDEIHYKNIAKDEYVKIIQEDGTTYTYSEYLSNHT